MTKSPGDALESLSWIEVRSGGGSVEAFLDLLLDDGDYSADVIEDALKELAHVIEGGARNPLTWTFRGQDNRAVHMVFSVNIGLEDLASKRRVLGDLSDRIRRWMRHDEAKIPLAIGQLAAGA